MYKLMSCKPCINKHVTITRSVKYYKIPSNLIYHNLFYINDVIISYNVRSHLPPNMTNNFPKLTLNFK